MLIADRLSKHYETPRGPLRVLRDVSFTVQPGEAIAIMGPSGCGKSTLLYILGALEPPTSGTITVAGTNPYGLDERAQAAFRGERIGFVFQDHLLLPQLSALDNVLAPTLVAPRSRDPSTQLRSPRATSRGERRERSAKGGAMRDRAAALLADVGLKDRLEHRPGELSGGERQRVALARALIREPSLLLCDEPTGNLDRASADTVADLLVALHHAKKTMLVVVTHSLGLASRFGQRFELNDARLQPA